MSELVLLCNDQEILCDSVRYYCDGSDKIDNDSYSTTNYIDVDYDNIRYRDYNYGVFNFFLDSNSLYFVVVDGGFFKVRGTTVVDNIRY